MVFNHNCSGIGGNDLAGARAGSTGSGEGVAELAFHRDKVFSHDDNIYENEEF